ncbi:AtzH-like domain-containing protein [Pseudonocardia lacus]|uniref:AtzH-like domain-containing protein n=1 Tax=Pseudonocardia lacus TaxID=2835865 RepID=UPI0027E24B8F|nr:AtzH-like domain-containing protein [Pseudonocardia lacus]
MGIDTGSGPARDGVANDIDTDIDSDGDAVLDRPETVAAVRAAFERYERALSAGDVAVLTELFWDDERCVRFGVADRQQGAAQIAAWRRTHPSVPPGRTLTGTRVLAVDDRTAVVTTLFGYPDGAVEGRQSQTWVRFAGGWRIVAAHVSELRS